jgi:hypothetical protein
MRPSCHSTSDLQQQHHLHRYLERHLARGASSSSNGLAYAKKHSRAIHFQAKNYLLARAFALASIIASATDLHTHSHHVVSKRAPASPLPEIQQ